MLKLCHVHRFCLKFYVYWQNLKKLLKINHTIANVIFTILLTILLNFFVDSKKSHFLIPQIQALKGKGLFYMGQKKHVTYILIFRLRTMGLSVPARHFERSPNKMKNLVRNREGILKRAGRINQILSNAREKTMEVKSIFHSSRYLFFTILSLGTMKYLEKIRVICINFTVITIESFIALYNCFMNPLIILHLSRSLNLHLTSCEVDLIQTTIHSLVTLIILIQEIYHCPLIRHKPRFVLNKNKRVLSMKLKF